MADAIKIDGLKQFGRDLKNLDNGLPKALRIALNDAADVIVSDARPRIPSRSGKAKASVKARSTRKESRVVGGGNRAPYYPWLDFGGRVGRGRSVRRPFLRDGRYIYDAYFDNADEFGKVLESALLDVAREAGVEVD